jgi:hypothetical protein
MRTALVASFLCCAVAVAICIPVARAENAPPDDECQAAYHAADDNGTIRWCTAAVEAHELIARRLDRRSPVGRALSESSQLVQAFELCYLANGYMTREPLRAKGLLEEAYSLANTLARSAMKVQTRSLAVQARSFAASGLHLLDPSWRAKP